MTRSHIRMLVQCAAVSAVLALLSLNCMSSGTMNGRLSLNISDQPTWGPTGYDRVEYYYFPDIDAYYYVENHQYVYLDGGTWRYSNSLPPSYGTFDVYHSYKVVINEDKPYAHNDEHRSKYRSYKGVKDQPVIRDSHDRKYFVNKDHPEHDKWERDNRH